MKNAWDDYCYGIQPQECMCGSGLEMFRCDDAEGDFVAHVCEECEVEKLSKYKPEIWKEGYVYKEYEHEYI
tara:strand:- start:1095 stop:1307 length:213 start_codon:yes stop_codon:yes gene_type:complete